MYIVVVVVVVNVIILSYFNIFVVYNPVFMLLGIINIIQM